MAQIIWQTPPFHGRRLGSGVPPTGDWDFQHHPQVPALHQGKAFVRAPQGGRFSSWGLYHSHYGFEIRADPGENGPFLLTIHAVVAGTVSLGLFHPGTSLGRLAQSVIIRRLSDNLVIHRGKLQAQERGRFPTPAPLHNSRTDMKLTAASEYRLDLVSYSAITVSHPPMSWPDTAGSLSCTSVGAGASVLLMVS